MKIMKRARRMNKRKKSKSGYVQTGKPRGRRPGQKNKNDISGTYNKNDKR